MYRLTISIDCSVPFIAGEVKLNLPKLMEQKVNAVKSLTQGVSMLFKKNKVTPVNGVGRITDPHTIVVTGKSGETKLTTNNIMIATGSEVAPLPGIQARTLSMFHCSQLLQLLALTSVNF